LFLRSNHSGPNGFSSRPAPALVVLRPRSSSGPSATHQPAMRSAVRAVVELEYVISVASAVACASAVAKAATVQSDGLADCENGSQKRTSACSGVEASVVSASPSRTVQRAPGDSYAPPV